MNMISMIVSLILAIGITIILNIIEFKNIEKKKLIYISFGIFIIFNNQFTGMMYLNQLLVILLIGIFEYLDEGKFFKGIIKGGIALLISMIVSSLTMSFMVDSIFNDYFEIIRIVISLINTILAISIAFFIRKIYIKLNQYKVKNISWKILSLILTLIVGVLSVYISLTPKQNFIGENGQEVLFYNGTTFTIYLVILVGFIYLLGKKVYEEIEYKQKLKEAERLEEYTSSLESMSEDLRKFKHDYINIMSSILGYIDDNDMVGLKDHIHCNILSLEKTINKNNSRLHLLKNLAKPEIKGLVSSKLIRAQELKINVEVDIMEEVEYVNSNMVLLCRIIGILLDNAIEECENIKNSDLSFGVIQHNNSIDFIVKNSCREDIEPIYILNSKGFSTKGENRGLGLFILEELIQENEDMFLDTIVENKTFTQILTIMG